MSAKFDFTFTEAQLTKLLPGNKDVKNWFAAINITLPNYEINTMPRVAAFIAQCGHESAGFKILKENLNYKAAGLQKVFPKYFPTLQLAESYANKPEKIASKVYGNRMGNGNEASGDGFKYCGRGLIQLTGKDNYTAFATALAMSLPDTIKYLETKQGAVESACWFWNKNKLNTWADKGDILTLTKRINGGTIGLQERINHYNSAVTILKS